MTPNAQDPLAKAKEELIAAALEWGEACDALRYPSLNILARNLKEAARRYTWIRGGRTHDPRPTKNGAAL